MPRKHERTNRFRGAGLLLAAGNKGISRRGRFRRRLLTLLLPFAVPVQTLRRSAVDPIRAFRCPCTDESAVQPRQETLLLLPAQIVVARNHSRIAQRFGADSSVCSAKKRTKGSRAMPERILRLPEVKTMCGLSRTSIYLHISESLFPQPLLLGRRMVGWPEREIAAMNAARIRGESDEAIRVLVSELVLARKHAGAAV